MVLDEGLRRDKVEEEMVERGESCGRKRKIRGRLLNENRVKIRRK